MFTNSLQLFAEKAAFELPFRNTAAGIFLCVESDQYGILANTFDLTPRDDDFGGFSEAHYAAMTGNYDGYHRTVLCIDLNIAYATELFARTQIDNVLVR